MTQVSRVVFGSDDDPLYKRFMVMIDSSMIGATGAGKGESPKIEVELGGVSVALSCVACVAWSLPPTPSTHTHTRLHHC